MKENWDLISISVAGLTGMLMMLLLLAMVRSTLVIVNNYSPKWRWLVVDIYQVAKRRGKYPTLATDIAVNS